MRELDLQDYSQPDKPDKPGQFDHLVTEEEIGDEIQKREDLMKQMVGWLYPRILQGEIDELEEKLRGLKRV